MKIAIAVKNYSKTGGISRYVAELAERYAGHDEVHVYASSWRDVGNSSIIFHKVPMINIRLLKKLKKHAWHNLFEVASFVLTSYFMIRADRYDIVHIQGDYMGAFDIYTAHSCHRAWLDIVNRQDLGILERLKKSAFNPLHAIILMIEKHNLRKAKKIISISEREKEYIIEHYSIAPEKIVPLPHGVDLDSFSIKDRDSKRKEIRAGYNFNADDTVLLFTAHEFKRKGLGQIIEAMNDLNRNDLKLLVIGKDDPAPYIELAEQAGLTERVIFAGTVSDIEDYYAAADLFVFPTMYEPFGLVILEAMAAGLPVITSRSAGAAELIEDGEEGLLLDDDKDVKEVADKIRLVMDNSSLRHDLGMNAADKARRYSWDDIAERTYKLYKEVLEAGKL
ncbi:glycosyltransferase family 4 protein [Elusimicrobiota bacterium]